ncbi:unnamed protein product [Paramecium sonneborni]|uniref:Uncharacterized protein n=1 Tax=Paramecium sonneborni TaxID=65129 RepID=A0A8S1PC80_9CILI|nr:unnamed protein product [Paramecium sonneborni]
MRSPSLFSPQKQSRYEKSNGPNGFAFQTTTQLNNTKQLTDYRKDVRTNVQSREPFVQPQEKSSLLFASWSKAEKTVLEQQKVNRKSPKKQKLLGGLNYEEIFTNKGPQTKYNNKEKVEQLFKKSPSNDYFDNSFTSFPKPAKQNTLGSGYKDSPQKSKEKLERFKNWDNRLDVQLILQNKSITNKISPTGDKPGFYKYVNETQKGLFDNNQSNFLYSKNNRNNLFDNPKQAFSFKDTFNPPKQTTYQKNHSPQLSNRYVEKFPLTDIVRMTSHFQSLSTQEVTSIPRGYISELNNLADILQRIVKRSNNIS